jgi:hypothetical protein
MNRIEVSVRVEHEDDGCDHLIARVLIDGAVFEAGEYATSLAALRSSVERDGEHFIISCECGVPGCAGLSSGVSVARRGGHVEWAVRQPGPERAYRFDAAAYRAAIEGAIHEFRAILAASREPGRKCVDVLPYGDESLLRPGSP